MWHSPSGPSQRIYVNLFVYTSTFHVHGESILDKAVLFMVYLASG